MISEKNYQEVVENSDRPLHFLWFFVNILIEHDPVATNSATFEKRRNIFLFILERLLVEKKIKLHKKGIFIESSIEDQLKIFRNAWPINEISSKYEDFYWWFLDSDCPAGIAWQDKSGKYLIAE